MSTPHEYLTYIHQGNLMMQVQPSSDWDGGREPSFECSSIGYLQEEPRSQWNFVNHPFPRTSSYTSQASPFSSPSFASPQSSAVSSVSLPDGRGVNMNGYETNYTTAYDDDLPTTDATTAAFFHFQLDDPSGVQEAFNQLIDDNRSSHDPSPDVSPFQSPCPTSSSRNTCSCTHLTYRQLMGLPHIPHSGDKRTRATGPICRRSLLERFHPMNRGLAIQILLDPDVRSQAALLGQLKAPHPDIVQENGFKHGCLCCPNAARCQSQKKVERHLRGLFDVRPFLCQYCGQGSIDIDDNKKHEKKCRLKANPSISP